MAHIYCTFHRKLLQNFPPDRAHRIAIPIGDGLKALKSIELISSRDFRSSK